MPARRCGRPLFFCKLRAAPSVERALADEKSAPARRAPGFSLARVSAGVFRRVWIRRKVLPALLSLMAPPDSRKQTRLRSVPWLWLLPAAGQFPIPLFSPGRRARRASSARPILPARREKFHSERAFPGWHVNPRAKFPAAEDSLFETFQLYRRFSCGRLPTISRKPAPAARSTQFSRVLFREVFLKLPESLFPSIRFAPRSLRAPVPATRAPSSPPEFLRGLLAPVFPERRRVPYPAASAAAPADPAPHLRQSSPPAKIAAR